jgi:DNA-binding CsgD family transcriptional regulator
MPALPPVTEATFELWRRLAAFPASETDAALKHLQKWIANEIDADNVVWIGAVRVLRGALAKTDPFLGWRLRARVALRPDPQPYRQQLAQYYEREHYGKLTPTYYQRSHEAQKFDHVGIGARAIMASAGRFRIIRLRDGKFFDFAEFKKSAHYQRYYLEAGIADRVAIGFPVTSDLESYFLIDRFQAKPRRRLFTHREGELAGNALRGVPQLHHRLLLGNGLLASDKLLSPMERQILKALLTGQTEKQMAAANGQTPATLHNYVTRLYTFFGVKSRPALMALWLAGDGSETSRSRS